MRTYIVDFITEGGRRDYRCVEARTLEDAVRIFRGAGVSWLGVDFGTVEIVAVAER